MAGLWLSLAVAAAGWLRAQALVPGAPEGCLRLANGDVYEGQWLPSDGGLIRWNSKWFGEPVLFECRYLEELSVKAAPHEYREEPFRVQIRNGDVLHGDLVALDERTITLQCERHGLLRLNRSGLLKLTRLNNPSLIYSGPSSLEGWMMLDTESRRRRENSHEPVQYWDPVPGGGLKTDRWRAELYRPLELPDKLEIDFQVSCSSRPEFSLALDQDVENATRVETWDDALVLTKGPRFQLIRFLGEGERRLRLRLFWDRTEGRLALYDDTADLLVSAPFQDRGKGAGGHPGFYIRNKSIDMALEQLRIARWNGQTPRKMQDQGIRIRKADGMVLRDGIVGFERSGNALLLQAGERLPVSDIDTIYFREDENLEPRKGCVEFSYPDGTRVSGSLLGVSSEQALVNADYAPGSVVVKLAGLRQIRFPGEEGMVSLDSGDELRIEGDTFRGTISGGGQPGTGQAIRWRALGSQNAVSIRPELSAQILRRNSQAVSNLDGDRLFLKTGEILSCRVERVDDKGVRLRTGLSSLREVPLTIVKAMEFREGRLQMTGFGDRDWQEHRSGPEVLLRDANSVTLNGGGLFHPSLLRGDEISFGLNWREKGQSAMTLGLFGGQLGAQHMPLEISFTCWGNRLWVSAAETATGQQLDNEDVMVEGGATQVLIKINGERLAVSLNGVELMQFEFDLEKRAGNGLALESGGSWPNGDAKLNPLVVDRFEIRSSSGLLTSLKVDDALKQRALSIPRFRREHPDEFILIGSNGDLIRGSLTTVDDGGVVFVTRLRDVRLPRERLAALIRLEDEAVPVPPPVMGKEVAVYLTDGSVVRVQPSEMSESMLEGTSPALGTCQLPVAHIRQIRLGAFEPVAGAALYADWVRKPAPEPVIPKEGESGGRSSGLVNQDAPDFSLRTVAGESFRLSAEKGNVVVLTFWASWSGQSRQCFDELLKAVGSAGDRVRFVSVNQAEPVTVVQKYLEKNKWSFDVAMDPSEKVGQTFGLEAIPHTVVIDAEGKIRWAQSGYKLGLGAEVAALLSELVKQAKVLPPPPAPEAPAEKSGNLSS